MTTTPATFDIRNFAKQLKPATGKNRYICPACGGNNLTINPKDGAYKCWNECECKAIREAIAPGDKSKGSQRPRPRPQQKSKPKAPLAFLPIPDGAIELAKLPNQVSSPARVQKGYQTEIIYPYSPTQWVVRVEDPEGKATYPYHIGTDGKPTKSKGGTVWSPYRMDEVRTHGIGKYVLGVEGEKCVEAARQLSLVSFTLQGGSWGEVSLNQAMQLIKDAGVLGVVYFPDNDTTGYNKAEKLAAAAASFGLPFIQIDPVRLWAECPNKGDIADWVELEMNTEEFIRRLEAEIYRAVEERKHSQQFTELHNDDDGQDIPDSISPNATFLQSALSFLYGDKPWISADNKLYYHTGTHYKYSPDSVEIPKIASFCNSFAVVNDEGEIGFPYAKPSKVDEVLRWVKYRFGINPELLNPPGLNCTNGVVQLIWDGSTPGHQLIDHDPALYYTYEPVVTYDPEASPVDCNRLLEVLDKPQQEIFLRTIAASLDLATVRRYKGRLVRGLLLKGDGNNGKDSLREIVSMMYGRFGLTGCTLSDFKAYDDGRKFPLSRLHLSRVNWATENANTAALDKLQSIKAFLTGDTLSAEGKGKDEFDYNPTAVGLFNINDTPNLKGTLEAIISRWGVLSFNKTFKIGADLTKGELEADPRFKYDPDFMRTQVLPAFLNRVLQALTDLMRDGIDYSCTQKALLDIQRENSHLFQFCQDVGLCYDTSNTVLASEIWDLLEPWYLDNGTLTYESGSNGKGKTLWNDQPRKSDPNVKAVNQVIARFSTLFPKAKVVTVPKVGGGKPRVGLQGIGFISPSILEASPNSTSSVTQFSLNASPKESLQDNAFHPSHPISPISERKNEKIEKNWMDCAPESDEQSRANPISLGESGENVDTASTLGCSAECKLGDLVPKLGDVNPAPDDLVVGSAENIREAITLMDGEVLEVFTQGWSNEFKQAVWALLSLEDKKAVEILAPGTLSSPAQLAPKRLLPEQLPIPKDDQIKVGYSVWVFNVRSREWQPGVIEEIEERSNTPVAWFVRSTDGRKFIARSLEKLRLR